MPYGLLHYAVDFLPRLIMVQQVLMVAEKPSIAEALAKSLCKGKYNVRVSFP